MQKALFESRYKDAFEIADINLLGTPPRIRSYQPLGDLLISYKWAGKPNGSGDFRGEAGVLAKAVVMLKTWAVNI